MTIGGPRVNIFSAQPAMAEESIKVFVDGQQIEYDVQPDIINDRVMVPIRGTFEALGTYPKGLSAVRGKKSVKATGGYLEVCIPIGQSEMYLNDKTIPLDAAATAVDGRVLVPLRAIAEAFSANVNYVKETNSVYITSLYPKNKFVYNTEFDPKHLISSKNENNYIDLQIDDDYLIISGVLSYTDASSLYYIVDAISAEGKERNLDLESVDINEDGSFYYEYPLTNIEIAITNSTITTRLSALSNNPAIYYDDIIIDKTDNGYEFEEPLSWKYNQAYFSTYKNPIFYIKSDIDPILVDVSNEICQDAVDDYDKVLKIHDWVAANIYYNYEYYYNRTSPIKYDALGVYNAKTTVCEGYANLTMALIHAQGIPCRKVTGYALGLSTSGTWTPENISSQTNHAWNQAFVDGRWINIDTTWDSQNKYKNGEWKTDGIEHRYFDISDTYFSGSHRCHE